jgi:hypothetical protein
MKCYTIADILALCPCAEYTEARLAELWSGRKGLTARQISELDIPAKDILWALIRFMPGDKALRLFACDCAERALQRERKAGREPNEHSGDAIKVARRYARGKATTEELAAAYAAAHTAAYAADAAASAAAAAAYAADAAAYAASAATTAATAYAADDDAYAAAIDAAAYDAYDAAYAAERRWQVKHALKYCEGIL